MNRIEKRIQTIKAYLLADENPPTGEERQTLLDELHELEISLKS